MSLTDHAQAPALCEAFPSTRRWNASRPTAGHVIHQAHPHRNWSEPFIAQELKYETVVVVPPNGVLPPRLDDCMSSECKLEARLSTAATSPVTARKLMNNRSLGALFAATRRTIN